MQSFEWSGRRENATPAEGLATLFLLKLDPRGMLLPSRSDLHCFSSVLQVVARLPESPGEEDTPFPWISNPWKCACKHR